jgi:hypothetical protein
MVTSYDFNRTTVEAEGTRPHCMLLGRVLPGIPDLFMNQTFPDE